MKSLAHAFVLLILITASASAEELPVEQLVAEMQAEQERFPFLGDGGDGRQEFLLPLDDATITLSDDNVYSGFRFRAPESLDGLDFIWYFNTPLAWCNWYVIPAKGKISDSFRKWFYADMLYEDYDRVGEEGRVRVLQTLDGNYFEPGAEYIMWFRKKSPEASGELRGFYRYVPKPEDDDEWSYGDLEEALGLVPMSDEVQVEMLDSRGGRILLDEEFFSGECATSHIEDIFTNMRMSQRFRGGYFITTSFSSPPPFPSPSMKAIREKYGEPDFIQTDKEAQSLLYHNPEHGEPEIENTVTYYYDYIGFEVELDDPKEKVLDLVSLAYSFADAGIVEGVEASYARVPNRNLTVFRLNGEEVGRMYFFMEGNKNVKVITEPPVGSYRTRDGSELTYAGDGKWTETAYFDEGQVSYVVPLVNNRYDGEAKGYYKDGSDRFVINYAGGLRHGASIFYDEEGNVAQERTYEEGKRTK